MDYSGAGHKRGRPDAALNGNGGAFDSKKLKEMEFFQLGIGSKSKPCTKFFSTTGCQFGEGCHFMHYVPGGINVVAQMTNLGNPALPPSRNPMGHLLDGSSPLAVKTRMCKKYDTVEGCKFGNKCHFAHGERELGMHILPAQNDWLVGPPKGGPLTGLFEPSPPAGLGGAAASFGASATAKISVDASLAGAIIGKGGVNSKQICRVTGAKLAIREHESDPKLRNIELEGTFDQIKHASAMVADLIVSISSAAPPPVRNHPAPPIPAASAGNYKTKLCENFEKGSCTFGEHCHFAHGAQELHKYVV